eukprot:gene17725-biopygen9893
MPAPCPRHARAIAPRHRPARWNLKKRTRPGRVLSRFSLGSEPHHVRQGGRAPCGEGRPGAFGSLCPPPPGIFHPLHPSSRQGMDYLENPYAKNGGWNVVFCKTK